MAKPQNVVEDDFKLAQLVNRIVTAQYAVSLKELYDLVQEIRNKNDHPCVNTLRRWADAKPCQVDALATAVLDGLQQWPYTLEILETFASSSESFGNAILRLQPTFLDECLKKVVDGDEKYFDTCISLLSYPLPEATLSPASLPSFVLKTIERMVQNPSPGTAESLYRLFSGIRATILDILPDETLVGFLTECKKTLRSLEDHMGNLLCLATLAKIVHPYTNEVAASSPSDQTKLGTSDDNTSERQESKQGLIKHTDVKKGEEHAPWLRGFLQFFGARHGMKTLDLVVARIILACSASSTLSLAESIHGIQLGKEICDAIEPEQRDVWIRNNGAILMKLCEKILRSGIDANVQAMGMVFLASLLESKMIPKEIIALGQKTLLSPEGRQNLGELPEDYMKLLVKKISPRFDEDTFRSVLETLVSALNARNVEDQSVFSNVNISGSIAVGLFSAMEIYPSMKSSIASALATTPGQELYKQVMTCDLQNKGGSCEGSCTCPSALSNARNKLYIDISAVILGSHLALTPDEQTPAAAPSWTHAFLSALTQNAKDKQTNTVHCPSYLPWSPQCFDHFNPFPRTQPPSTTLSLHHQPPGSSHDWKAGLAEDLLKDSQQSHKAIIQRVSAVCRDLEERCNHVEAPVRDLSSKLDKMTTDCKSAQKKNLDMEEESKGQSQTIAALRDENSRLEQQAQSSETRAEDLSTRLQSAQKAMEDLKHRSKKNLNTVNEKAREMELEYLATLTSRDDAIDEMHEQLARVKTDLDNTREQLAAAAKEKSEAQQNLEILERALSESKQSVDAKSGLNTELQEEIGRLRVDKEYMRSVTDRLQSKVDENVQESRSLNEQIMEKEEIHQNQLEILKREKDEEHSKLAAEVKQQKNLHKEEVQKVQTRLHSAESKAAQEIQDRDKRIKSLEHKVTLLRQERESKAREFAEAQDLSTRLMAIMDKRSFDKNESQPLDAAEHYSGPPQERLSNSTTEEEGDTEQEELKTQVSHQVAFGSLTSSNSTNAGPTPKRPKSSRNYRSPCGKDDHADDDGKTNRPSLSTAKEPESSRQPLEETGLNQSPAKPSTKSGSTQSSSRFPENSQDSKLGSQFDVFEDHNGSYDYSDSDLDDLEYLDDDRLISTPSF